MNRFLIKRVLILFSVALNIGFVVFALTNTCTAISSNKSQIRKELISIVQNLNMPPETEKRAIDSITEFSDTMQTHETTLSKDRDNILLYLAKPGPLDPKRLSALIMKVDTRERTNRELFAEHVTELRAIMGDKKGPLFFSLMLAQIGHKNKPH